MLLIIIFLISSTSAPKNISKHRALFSECGVDERLLWMGEYEAGKEKKSQYTHYKKLDYTTAPTHKLCPNSKTASFGGWIL